MPQRTIKVLLVIPLGGWTLTTHRPNTFISTPPPLPTSIFFEASSPHTDITLCRLFQSSLGGFFKSWIDGVNW